MMSCEKNLLTIFSKISISDKIILHWLDQSRSHRILWLLEELSLNYELKVYRKTKEGRAPPGLNKAHPLRKSPVIEIISAKSGDRKVIAETGYILSYLIRDYDINSKLTPSSADGKELVEYYLHYAEGTLQSYLVAILINSIAIRRAPVGTKFLMRRLVKGINGAYYGPELIKNLDYLENILKDQHSKKANIFFPIEDNIFSNPERVKILTGSNLNMVERYPNLHEWSQRIARESHLIKADEIIQRERKGAKL